MNYPEADQHGRAAAAGSTPLTPSAARRQLGEELKGVREKAGLTLDAAAKRIQRSAPTLSRIENGKTVPRVVDVVALVDQYREESPAAVPNGTRERVLQLAETARRKEWFAPFRDVISSDMTGDEIQRFVEFERDATRIQAYQPELVPGLLQTRAYAEAVTALFFSGRTPAERARFVEFRLARQHVLHRSPDPLHLDVVIGEVALRRRIGSPEVMREQLIALLDNVRNGLSHVRIRIAPVELAVPAVVGGPFILLDLPGDEEADLVFLESRGGDRYVQNQAVIDRYRGLFQDLSDVLRAAPDSEALLEEALKELG